MPNRPAIPAEIARQVLVESGHRCAVCGTVSPLELAHIIPWHKSKEHKAENLVCLCANCHRRAHKEKWGAKDLREYKQKPWIHRQYEKVVVPEPTTQQVLREKAPQLDRALTSASTEVPTGGDAMGNMVITAGRDVIYLSLTERDALHRALSYVADDALRHRLALLA